MSKGKEKGSQKATSSIKKNKDNNRKTVNLALLHRELDRLMAESRLFLKQLEEHHEKIMEELEGGGGHE